MIVFEILYIYGAGTTLVIHEVQDVQFVATRISFRDSNQVESASVLQVLYDQYSS